MCIFSKTVYIFFQSSDFYGNQFLVLCRSFCSKQRPMAGNVAVGNRATWLCTVISMVTKCSLMTVMSRLSLIKQVVSVAGIFILRVELIMVHQSKLRRR